AQRAPRRAQERRRSYDVVWIIQHSEQRPGIEHLARPVEAAPADNHVSDPSSGKRVPIDLQVRHPAEQQCDVAPFRWAPSRLRTNPHGAMNETVDACGHSCSFVDPLLFGRLSLRFNELCERSARRLPKFRIDLILARERNLKRSTTAGEGCAKKRVGKFDK